jgi:hypothetical protein
LVERLEADFAFLCSYWREGHFSLYLWYRGQDTHCPEKGFLYFPQLLKANARIKP